MYCGSADLLPRNLDHRIEVLFPINNADIRERIHRDVLLNQLRDTVNAWEEQSDGTYRRILPKDGEEAFDSQEWSINHG
jgi:polyphosphate kinase